MKAFVFVAFILRHAIRPHKTFHNILLGFLGSPFESQEDCRKVDVIGQDQNHNQDAPPL